MTNLEKALKSVGYDNIARIQKRLLNFTINENGCWVWNGLKTELGYARTEWNRKNAKAHRVIYQLIYGQLDREQVLDHLCRVRDCVNPKHLEPVTQSENLMRGMGVGAINARKTHCIRGHEYSPENTYYYKYQRSCRICTALRYQEQKVVA